MIIRGNYIYPGRTVLNPCFDAGPSSRRVRCAGRYPAGPPPFSPLDGGSRGTKINIVDDENKILDTGPTATGRGEGGVLAPACHAPLPPPPSPPPRGRRGGSTGFVIFRGGRVSFARASI